MVLGDMKAAFAAPPPPRDLGVLGATIVECGLSCLVDLNSNLYVCIVYRIEINLKNLKTTLINRTLLRTKGQSAGYPQAKLKSLPILSSVERLSEL